MSNHCHSPNPKLISSNSKYNPLFNSYKSVSENVCLTNYGSPNLHMNLHTEQCNNQENKSKITYQLSSKNNASPTRTLRQNQSMLFQNISPEITFSNKNNVITKSNSLNLSRKRKYYMNNNNKNENTAKNNINKKNELLDKIRSISKRIDKTINLYKDKNCNINSYSRKNKYRERNSSNFPLNFKYNSKVLESMKRESNRKNQILNDKYRNLSQAAYKPNDSYKKLDSETKKRKANYDKLNKQKKFYVDNNNYFKSCNENNNKNVTYVYDSKANNAINENREDSESSVKKR